MSISTVQSDLYVEVSDLENMNKGISVIGFVEIFQEDYHSERVYELVNRNAFKQIDDKDVMDDGVYRVVLKPEYINRGN